MMHIASNKEVARKEMEEVKLWGGFCTGWGSRAESEQWLFKFTIGLHLQRQIMLCKPLWTISKGIWNIIIFYSTVMACNLQWCHYGLHGVVCVHFWAESLQIKYRQDR